MSDLNLPPLYYVWRARSAICVTKESVEARERILMAHIAELQDQIDALIAAERKGVES